MTPRRFLLLAWIAVCGLVAFLTAENRAFSDTPRTAAAQADTDVTNFGDWRFACSQADKKSPKECRIYQRVTWGKDKARKNAVSVAMFMADDKAAVPKGEKKPVAVMRIVAPLGVDLRSGMTMVIGSQGKVVRIPYSVCIPVGCAATFGLAADATDKIKGSDGVTISFKGQGAPKPVGLKLSTKGFSSAFDALLKAKS